MNIRDILSDASRQKLQLSVPEDTTAAEPVEENPLVTKTKASIKQHTVVFRSSRRKALPQKLLIAFHHIHEQYQNEIEALCAQTDFAVPVHLNYTVTPKKDPRKGYDCILENGLRQTFDKHNANLQISVYHDYIKDIDLFRISLSRHNSKTAEPHVRQYPQTYALPVNHALQDFFAYWKNARAAQAKRRTKQDYLEPVYTSFVAFDLERTGRLKGEAFDQDKIIEIGAVKVVKGEIVATFDQLVDPQKEMLYRVIKITGIKPGMLRGKPTSDKAVRDFLDFAGDSVLIGHSLDDNDLPPIRHVAKKLQLPFLNKHYDTFRLAQLLQEQHGFEHTNLEYLSDKLQVKPQGFHRADADAATTAMVYLKLRALYYQTTK